MMPKQSPSTQTAKADKTSVMPKKVYSREFKLETLRLLKSSGKTKADLERELGLYPGQIRLWERAFNKGHSIRKRGMWTGWSKPSQAHGLPEPGPPERCGS
jgi:transposase-like protein